MEYLAIVPILAFLIVIHELGHFFAARSVGVTVEEFGIGLPPRVKGWRRNGVLWSLNALPIGGFVRVKGEDANDRDPGSMQNASPWARGWFLIAGPLMNLLAAVIISMLLVATVGVTKEGAFISSVQPDSPAEMAGWQPGDRIVEIDGVEIDSIQDAIGEVNANTGSEITIVIERGNEVITTQVTPRENPPEGQGSTGITFGNGRFSDVRVNEVRTGSLAAEAGLHPGDEIVAINGIEIVAMAQAIGIMDAYVGDDITLTYERDGERHDVALTVPEPSLPVTSVTSGSPAAKAELYASDQITAVNGTPITTGQAFIDTMIENSGKSVELTYVRTTAEGPMELTTTMDIPGLDQLEPSQALTSLGLSMLQPSGFHEIGIEPIGYVTYHDVSAGQIIPLGWNQFTGMVTGMVDSLQSLFSGAAPIGSLMGPIGMGQVTGEMLDAAQGNALPVLLQLTMMISLSLGIFNLLPIPALDGGRLVFVILEILRGGKRVPPEKEGAVHMIGMLVLLGLIFFIAFGDISRILNGESILP